MLLLPTGCSGSGESPENQLRPGETLTIPALHGQATAQVHLDGTTLAEGASAFVVELDPPEAELTGASAMMPAHGHGSPTAAVIQKTSSRYRVSNLTFSMPGLWNVLLDVGVSGKQDRLEFSVDIP